MRLPLANQYIYFCLEENLNVADWVTLLNNQDYLAKLSIVFFLRFVFLFMYKIIASYEILHFYIANFCHILKKSKIQKQYRFDNVHSTHIYIVFIGACVLCI